MQETEATMLSLEQVRSAIRGKNLHPISLATGLSYATVWKVSNDRQNDFFYSVVKRLSDYVLGEMA